MNITPFQFTPTPSHIDFYLTLLARMIASSHKEVY